VIRRLVALLSEQANLEAQHEAALKMGRNASAEAERLRANAEVDINVMNSITTTNLFHRNLGAVKKSAQKKTVSSKKVKHK